MRFSKFTHIYECISKDRVNYIIRHSLTNKSFLFNLKEFNDLQDFLKQNKENKNVQILEENHLIVPDSYKEDKFLKFFKDKYNLDKFNLEIIYLLFNSSCNLNCKYCYVEGSKSDEFNHESMKESDFNQLMIFLDNLIKEIKKKEPKKNKLTFIFYGSEPLMSKKLFIQGLNSINNICHKNKITPDFQLITNGTLLDKEITEQLKKFRVQVSISLDGNEKINDIMRKYHSGKGTYKEVIKGIRLLNKDNIPFGISCTISSHNINNLIDNVKFFKKIGAKSVSFNILLNARFLKIPLISLEKLNDNLIEASAFANENNLYEDRIQRKVTAFNNLPRFKDCGGVGNQLVFFPNGDISVCEAYLCNRKYTIGNIKDNLSLSKIENHPVVKKWTERYPLNMKECVMCPSLGICGGGCAFNAETNFGDISKRDLPFCVHTNKCLNWLLKKSLKDKTDIDDYFIWDITSMCN
jgi:uncharacterized protein